MDMQIDVFATQSYGKAALQKLAPVPPNFRLYQAGWLGEKLEDRQVMKVTGAEFRVAKTGKNAGKLSIMIKGTARSTFVTKDEMQAFDAPASTTALRVFSINDDEWWVGEGTPEEILKAYMEAYGCSHEDATGDADELPTPLTDDQMDRLTFAVGEDGKRLAEPITFRDYLAKMVARGATFPCLFAMTQS